MESNPWDGLLDGPMGLLLFGRILDRGMDIGLDIGYTCWYMSMWSSCDAGTDKIESTFVPSISKPLEVAIMARRSYASVLVLVLAVLVIVTGCVNVSEDQAQRWIKGYIFRRYGSGYEIGPVSFTENQMYGGGSYHATVTEKERGLRFSVTCRGFNGEITDDLAQTLYEDQMYEKVSSILERCPFASEIDLGVVWKGSPSGWKPSMSFEEFFEEYSNVDILLGLGIDDRAPSQKAQALWELFQQLEPDHNALIIDLWSTVEPYHSSVNISDEDADDLEYIQGQLQKLERFDAQILQGRSILEGYPFLSLRQIDVDSFPDHIRLGLKLEMSEERPEESAEELYELCCRLDAQEFAFDMMLFNTVRRSDGEEWTGYEWLYATDWESVEELRQKLLKLTPKETTPTDPEGSRGEAASVDALRPSFQMYDERSDC